jgi:hypothetical protein
MKITLPNDAWAELRDPKAVPERLRRPVSQALLVMGKNQEAMTAADATSLSAEALASFESLNDLLIVARVSAWSLNTPVSLESVLDLPSDLYNALREATAPGMMDMMPDFSASEAPDSPTNPFSD